MTHIAAIVWCLKVINNKWWGSRQPTAGVPDANVGGVIDKSHSILCPGDGCSCWVCCAVQPDHRLLHNVVDTTVVLEEDIREGGDCQLGMHSWEWRSGRSEKEKEEGWRKGRAIYHTKTSQPQVTVDAASLTIKVSNAFWSCSFVSMFPICCCNNSVGNYLHMYANVLSQDSIQLSLITNNQKSKVQGVFHLCPLICSTAENMIVVANNHFFSGHCINYHDTAVVVTWHMYTTYYTTDWQMCKWWIQSQVCLSWKWSMFVLSGNTFMLRIAEYSQEIVWSIDLIYVQAPKVF